MSELDTFMFEWFGNTLGAVLLFNLVLVAPASFATGHAMAASWRRWRSSSPPARPFCSRDDYLYRRHTDPRRLTAPRDSAAGARVLPGDEVTPARPRFTLPG